jgi:hypothetical protein
MYSLNVIFNEHVHSSNKNYEANRIKTLCCSLDWNVEKKRGMYEINKMHDFPL